MSKYLLLILITLLLVSCQDKQAVTATLIIINANIDTRNEQQPSAQAIAMDGNSILAVGSNDEIAKYRGGETRSINAKGAYVSPGLIDAHAHLRGLGEMLLDLNLLDSKSYTEVVEKTADRLGDIPEEVWIEGRGWHQEKWEDNPSGAYPDHQNLSLRSPSNPVVLYHASGHGLLANELAMKKAGIHKNTPDPTGGHIVRNKQGEATGVFEENAMQLITEPLEAWKSRQSEEELESLWIKQVEQAQDECLKHGITCFHDAGSSWRDIQRYHKLAKNDALKLRLWSMVLEESQSLEAITDELPITVGDKFYCNAVKAYMDGALGSFGAWMLKDYTEKPGHQGQTVTAVPEVKALAKICADHELQLCVHAIGDRANRQVLDIYEQSFPSAEALRKARWRIEHAQHLSPDDIPRFGKLGVIASMQGIHCTSDAPYVVKRLGEQRAATGAYPWRSLIDAGARIANGTDAPVEKIDPRASLYASVSRKRTQDNTVFYPDQQMTRQEALNSYTRNNAFAAFLENKIGMLKPGMLADLVIWDTDLLNCEEVEILDTEVIYTVFDGEVVYQKDNLK